MGFASEFVALEGTGFSAALNLLYANVGIEAAQLLVVLVVLVIGFICLNIMKLNKREFILFTSGAIFGIATEMVLTRLPF
jgi:hypothetical protein